MTRLLMRPGYTAKAPRLGLYLALLLFMIGGPLIMISVYAYEGIRDFLCNVRDELRQYPRLVRATYLDIKHGATM